MAEADKTECKAMEADIKRLLNLSGTGGKDDHSGSATPAGSKQIIVTKEDLANIHTHKAEKKKNKPNKKTVEEKTKQPDTKTPEANTTDGNQAAVVTKEGEKKQKKKKNRNRARGKKQPQSEFFGKKKVQNENVSESEDSDSGSDQAPPPKAEKFNLDFIRMKYLDDKLTPAILNELEKERIFPLKKKSLKFAHAKYFCRLCDYHCDNVPLCRQHAQDARHRRRKEIRVQDQKLKKLPTPSARHITALDNLVETLYSEYGLSSADLVQRHIVALKIQDFIMKHIKDVKLQVYGSSLTGFGLKGATLDLDLLFPEKGNPANYLVQVYDLLKASDTFDEVKSHFQSKVPAVTFLSPCKTLNCQITVGTGAAVMTSRYLAIYRELDERCRKLAIVFKHWAKVCEVDCQEAGSLPAYVYSMMTIFYLQQCSTPVLPVLWKDLTESALKRPKTAADEQAMLSELKQQPWTSNNELSVGALWRDMILFYGLHFDLSEHIICVRSSKLLTRMEKKWKSKRVAIEDPFSPKRNAGRSMYNTRIFDYFYNCLRKACLYFSLPTSHQNMENYYKDRRHTTYTQKDKEKMAAEQTRLTSPKNINADTRAEVKNGGTAEPMKVELEDLSEETPFSRLMSVGCEEGDDMVKLKESDKGVEADKGVNRDNDVDTVSSDALKDKLEELTSSTEVSSDQGIPENEFFLACKQGLVKNVSEFEDTSSLDETDKVSEVTSEVEKLKVADSDAAIIKDVGIDSSACGTKCDELGEDDNDNPKCSSGENAFLPPAKSVNNGTVDAKVPGNEVSNVIDTIILKIEASGDELMQRLRKSAKDDRTSSGSDSESNSSSGDGDDDLQQESPDSSPLANRRPRVSSPAGAEYDFEFTAGTLTDGKGPSVFCAICEKEGHLKSVCPEDQLPPIIKLSPPTKAHLELLSAVIKQVPRDFQLSPSEIQERDAIRRNLEYHIKQTFQEAELKLFGSSMNGFGFHQSDLDICVTFKGKNPEDLNFVEYIEAICKKLKTHRDLYGVFPITTAKVPIVKFKHRASQLEGDISLYNILALQNTALLLAYSNIDPRVQILGYAVKVFAKVCEIGDASRGSLSSYAYMLMMVHYLQHTNPPVIPVLQELRLPDEPDKELIVEGWNTWFFNNLDMLPQVWPGYSKNIASVGELWLGFFRYFLEEFNLTEQVVTIRQFRTLSKFEKLWNGKCIAIEDPFDLNHNLGGALSRKMNQYIVSTLVHARELYGKSLDLNNSITKQDIQGFQDFFFDRQQLVVGDPPSDRLCRVCSKIGHIAKECPRLIARKEREANERRRREEQRNVEKEGGQSATPNNTRHSGNSGMHRSMSEPSTNPAHESPQGRHTGSPHRGHGHQGRHQHSYSQSPDKRDRPRPLLGMPTPEKFRGPNSASPSSPHSPRWQNQSDQGYYRDPLNSGQSNQGYSREYPNTGQSNQSYQRGNQNENSSGRRYPIHPNHRNSGPKFYSNQSYDRQRGDAGYYNHPRDTGRSTNYSPSSPGQQHREDLPSKQHYEGNQQGPKREREVNIPRNRNKDPADMGITVRNEFYKN
ncbi:terminal uridylyltransferase 4-like [Mya arenaria]|uniref:terminal uridylyltransferase 4-like n=1 Tax=Mya arenaria TaxID=6604 RepID=UPI0022E699A4|nr:terminal uridylyltransferase 4-like [Mya arenaria]XP_052775837.1 terminal uridylyltransferase 4-like [Mya arenaria]